MQIGRFVVPGIRLFPTLVEAVRLIYGRYSLNQADDMDEVARLLGHKSAHSGAFLLKMSLMRRYGLIEGRAYVKVTELGKSIAYPESREEEVRAVESALNKISLWSELYKRFGAKLPEEGFSQILAEVAGCSFEEAAVNEKWIRKAYSEDAKLLESRRIVLEPPLPEVHKKFEAKRLGEEEIEELKLGDVQILIPPSMQAVETARALLDLYEKRLKSRLSNPTKGA